MKKLIIFLLGIFLMGGCGVSGEKHPYRLVEMENGDFAVQRKFNIVPFRPAWAIMEVIDSGSEMEAFKVYNGYIKKYYEEKRARSVKRVVRE